MVTPQNCDIRQPRESWSSKNRDLWLRPTDLSWHFPILMTFRGEPFKNYRPRTSATLKAKGKTEEFEKQKMQKNDDERSYANWQTSSWSWHQPMTWTTFSGPVEFGRNDHQLMGVAQIKRVSIPNGDHQVPGKHRSHGSEE